MLQRLFVSPKYFAHLLDIYDERLESYSKTGLAFYVLAIFLVWFG